MGGADFVQWHGNYPMLQEDGGDERHGRGTEESNMAASS